MSILSIRSLTTRPLRAIGPACSLLLLSSALEASEPSSDKSGYTLFNPTPRAEMRELSTDRPDQTESPYTVDAGHWQFEFDFFNYTHDRENGVRTQTLNVAPLNAKLGLTNSADLQLIFDNYTTERVRTGGATTTTRDWGDVTIRVKQNLWGNDGGDTAFAVMPFVKIPLHLGDAGNDLVEGGVILPLAIALPRGWNLGLMTEVDVLANDTPSPNGSNRHFEWINSITFSHDITKKLGGYVEFFSAHSYENGTEWSAQIDVGLTYSINNDTQLDVGCNFGATRNAPDVQPFLGLTLRY